MQSLPRVFGLNARALRRACDRLRQGDDALQAAGARLIQEAEESLCVGPFSVMGKTLTPPSGDKHDYASFGPYWWPDPDRPDGLPYVRRDGSINPESTSDRSDSPALGQMVSAVDTLAVAYYLTGEGRYGARAAYLVRWWFLDSSTRMNPHLEYGQAIPGRVEGRGIGIIDTLRLIRVIDAVGLLSSSSGWIDADQRGTEDWFPAYLKWLRSSEKGRDEETTLNNHSTWYDAQVACFALFLRQQDLAREVLQASRSRRIRAQIEPDGQQPHELRRTKSLGYSIMNLRGMFALAEMGEQVGLDLWNWETEDGRGIRRALDYLVPFADLDKEWPHQQIQAVERVRILPLLLRAALAYGDARYLEAADLLPRAQRIADRAQLLYAQ